MVNDAVAAAAAEHLRKIQDSVQALAGAPGPKALARRFGDLLAKDYGVTQLDCLRVLGKAVRGAKLSLKRRDLQIEGAAVFSDEMLTALAQILAEELDAGEFAGALRDGGARLSVLGVDLTAVLLDDPRTAGGALLVWRSPAEALSPLAAVALETLVKAVQREARWLRRLDKTQAMLYQDDLTGLYNYRYLEIALDHELRRADRFQSQFCLLFIDMDGFKPINDEHGHTSGSSVLRQVAEVIREAVREVDIPIRYGGDEFVVVLLGATTSKGLLAAERVRRRIEAREFQLESGATTRLTASIGIASYPEHGRDRATLLKMADETMYTSKKTGKNRVTVVARRAET